MKSKLLYLIRDNKGAVFIEAAFLLFALVPIFFGLYDYGLSMYEWKRVNNALQAQVLYVAATHGISYPSQSQQLNGTKSFMLTSIPAINGAGQNSSTSVKSSDITFSYDQWCGCSSGSSLNLINRFADRPPYCPQPPNISCNQSSFWGSYVIITASHHHKSLFNTGAMRSIPFLSALADILTPNMKSSAVVRIN